MPRFKGSIIRGASLINPDTIEITDRFVVFKNRHIVKEHWFIPIKK
jgi:hypothetical protein